MDPSTDDQVFDDSYTPTTLYQASPPSLSPVWRLHFLDIRETSHNDVIALLYLIKRHVAIHVLSVVRTWDEHTPVYWVLFGNTMQALAARGFAANAEGSRSVKVSGALVPLELFHLAEEEERNPHAVAPIEPNRWDDPLRVYIPPTLSEHKPHNSPNKATTASQHYNDNRETNVVSARDESRASPNKPLYERIKHATLLERMTSP
ncbi:hypothetical protein PLEOSDRAFT_1102740 [Pleurotus ostreatus PC15]|uniref:Uncharacterized protein n=1 Tax=Pleurotus ostreatus (strain PC15) TaxID=1137138 RepID=A0A067NX39_PLEO1|nr:hypothetical protein PLEOSDRAFT_1102740 [Pleurotus ostreatus PC15]